MKFDKDMLIPTLCNICFNKLTYTSIARIHRNPKQGSGYCYYCTNCGAYTDTEVDEPRIATGLLTNQRMRDLKVKCGYILDSVNYDEAVNKICNEMGIEKSDFKLQYMNEEELEQIYCILKKYESKVVNNGKNRKFI